MRSFRAKASSTAVTKLPEGHRRMNPTQCAELLHWLQISLEVKRAQTAQSRRERRHINVCISCRTPHHQWMEFDSGFSYVQAIFEGTDLDPKRVEDTTFFGFRSAGFEVHSGWEQPQCGTLAPDFHVYNLPRRRVLHDYLSNRRSWTDEAVKASFLLDHWPQLAFFPIRPFAWSWG